MTTSPADASSAVYGTVSYADVFDLPISNEDLERFVVGQALTSLQTSAALNELVRAGKLSRRDGLISLTGRDGLIDRHEDRTIRAAGMWAATEAFATRIGRLPFVRMVAVTGKLALNSWDQGDVVELFIVTRPRRLWLTRMMIQATARRAATRNIAMRPLVIASTRGLEFAEHSMYLAREIVQMIVVVGGDVCEAVRRSNGWIFDLLPNATISADTSHLAPLSPSSAQKWLEWFLLLPPFRLLESWQRERTIKDLARTAAHSPALVSEEVCAPDLITRAREVESAWTQRLEDD